jgi:hypothetical protein
LRAHPTAPAAIVLQELVGGGSMAASDKTAKDQPRSVHMTKKCPECFTYLPLDAKVCQSCGKSVGPVTRVGLAEKPPSFKGYAVAAIAILAFVGFVWWGFFTE